MERGRLRGTRFEASLTDANGDAAEETAMVMEYWLVWVEPRTAHPMEKMQDPHAGRRRSAADAGREALRAQVLRAAEQELQRFHANWVSSGGGML